MFGGDRELSGKGRLAFFVGSLAALGSSYAATGSEGLQILVFLGLTFGALPALRRRYGVDDPYIRIVSDRNVPWRFMAASLSFAIPWGAATLFLVPDPGLGPCFWLWAFFLPWHEVYRLLVERGMRRGEADGWREQRPVRDVGMACLVLAPVIVAIMLVDGAGPGEAVLTGVACTAVFFVEILGLMWLMRRARQAAPGSS